MIKISKVIFLFSVVALISCENKNQSDGPIPPVGYLNYTLLEWSVGLGLVDMIDREPPIPPSITIDSDIIFKETESRNLTLDILKRKDQSGVAPVLIFIHGGSWKYGGKEDYSFYLHEYAKKGYVTASLSYRLSQEAKFPSAVEDVKCGIRWIQQNGSQFGIDTNNVILIGGSAGAHLAMMAGYTDLYESCGPVAAIKGIVNIYGPVDLTTEFALSNSALTEFIGIDYDENPNPYQDASPINYVSSDDPPTITFHGTIDRVVPIGQADTLDKKLKNMGVYHDYHRIKGWPHTMDLSVTVNNYMQFYMDQFFENIFPKFSI